MFESNRHGYSFVQPEKDEASCSESVREGPSSDVLQAAEARSVLGDRGLVQRALSDAGVLSPAALQADELGSMMSQGGDVHLVAAQGTGGAGGPLPHASAIQASFGRFDIGGIRAHTGAAADAAAKSMGANAFATGSEVGFATGKADLRTAAHEAAHVVQQSAGVQLSGGVGQVGDKYEQHADAVADKVVRGESAEGLLSEMASRGSGTSAPVVQRMVGLEFETSKVAVTPGDYKTVLADGPGFKAEADSGNLEIVTDPYPATMAGKRALKKATEDAVSFVGNIQGGMAMRMTTAAKKKFGGDIAWRELGQQITLKRKGAVTCHPQATMGIPLSTMIDMYETIQKETPTTKKGTKLPHFAMDQRVNRKTKAKKFEPMKGHMRQALATAKQTVTEMAAAAKLEDHESTEMLTGLLTQILTSINSATDTAFNADAGWNAHNVRKNQFVALPKTKLHHMYKLMSRQERKFFVEWVKTKAPNRAKEILPDITIGAWLDNIYNPSVGLELAEYDEQMEGLGSDTYAEEPDPDRTLKAMTDNLGSPTNIGTGKEEGQKNESGGIFEFRHLKAEVPLNEWPQVAEEAAILAIVLDRAAKGKKKAQKDSAAAREAKNDAEMAEWMATTFG